MKNSASGSVIVSFLGIWGFVLSHLGCQAELPVRIQAAAGSKDTAPSIELVWGGCDTDIWPERLPKPTVATECTIIQVPFRHEDPGDARVLSIRVARQKSQNHPTGKAVFQLAGGPGGASVWQTGIGPKYFAAMLPQFDLVYVDQRGTGASGYLGCSCGYPTSKEDWIDCAQEHQQDDLNHYLTVDAADDLDFVRRKMGYEKIYIRGGSYGTRLGLEYIRRHGDRVIAAVLDGLDPPDLDIMSLALAAADRGVERLHRDCEKDKNCHALLPDVRSALLQRRQSLTKRPRPILADGKKVVEDETLFLEVLRFALFESRRYFSLPGVIAELGAGNTTPWNQMISAASGQQITDRPLEPNEPYPPLRIPGHVGQGISYVAPAIYATVSCAEVFSNSPNLEELRKIVEKTTWGVSREDWALAQACHEWKVSGLPPNLRRPVFSEAKVLLMSGDLDLDTFPEWGEHVAKTLPNSLHVIIPYATHSTMSIPCAGSIMADFFMADGDLKKVDLSCVKSIEPPG